MFDSTTVQSTRTFLPFSIPASSATLTSSRLICSKALDFCRVDGAVEKGPTGQRETTGVRDDLVYEPIEKLREVRSSIGPQKCLDVVEIG